MNMPFDTHVFERRRGRVASICQGTLAGIGIASMSGCAGSATLGFLFGIFGGLDSALAVAVIGGMIGSIFGALSGVIPGMSISSIHAFIQQPSVQIRRISMLCCAFIGGLVGIYGGLTLSESDTIETLAIATVFGGFACGSTAGAVGGYFLERAIHLITWRNTAQPARTSGTDIDSSRAFENTSE